MIYAIVGPTASGKSKLGFELAKKFNGIIINGDAFQIYQEMNIGTAKPTLEELNVPHYLYNLFPPNHELSIFEYQKLLRDELTKYQDKNIFLVGGSGLYLKSALYDFTLKENSSFDMSKYDNYSNEELYSLLKSIDMESALKTHANNRKRVLRALEIYYSTGEKKSCIESKQAHKLIYDVMFIGIDIPRDELYARINKRVDEMVEKGLFLEVKNLLKKYPPTLKAFQAIGYKQIINGINENQSEAKIIEEIKKVSRNYAKRQITYFKNQMDVHWIKTFKEACELISNNY